VVVVVCGFVLTVNCCGSVAMGLGVGVGRRRCGLWWVAGMVWLGKSGFDV
jgi:hypothetical protein